MWQREQTLTVMKFFFSCFNNYILRSCNNRGGKWMVRLKKGIASHYWEQLLLAIIGEQFDVGSEICGAVVSVRNSEDIISVWNKNADNKDATNKIRDQMRRTLKLPSFIAIEYQKTHRCQGRWHHFAMNHHGMEANNSRHGNQKNQGSPQWSRTEVSTTSSRDSSN